MRLQHGRSAAVPTGAPPVGMLLTPDCLVRPFGPIVVYGCEGRAGPALARNEDIR